MGIFEAIATMMATVWSAITYEIVTIWNQFGLFLIPVAIAVVIAMVYEIFKDTGNF